MSKSHIFIMCTVVLCIRFCIFCPRLSYVEIQSGNTVTAKPLLEFDIKLGLA